MAAKPRIIVLGGGFGGLEAAFYLRMRLHERVDITLISDREYFLFKPNTIYIPFGLDPEQLKVHLEKPTRRKDILFVQHRALEIDTAAQQVITADGTRYSYDYLVVATGASMRPSEIPGLTEHAQTIWTPQEMLKLRDSLQTLRTQALTGQNLRVLFMVPPNNKCAGPLYEMVFMLDTWLRQQGIRKQVDVTWSTYENSYIQAFGPRLNEVAEAEFAHRDIEHHAGYVVQDVQRRTVNYQNGASLDFDLLISFPPYVAATVFDGLPADDRGFIAATPQTRQVVGYPNVYVAGDAGDFPVKQAFLAFLQADAIAEHLSAQVLGGEPEFMFEPVSMCVMEQFDKATFAQVPLAYTNSGVRVLTDSPLYKTGTSPVWRLGKGMLGLYLPWRFNAGEPFHAGLPWKGMEAGLKVMAGAMAH